MRLAAHTFADVRCETCGADPGQRCETMAGFGGAHAARVREALTTHRCTDECRRTDGTTPREETE